MLPLDLRIEIILPLVGAVFTFLFGIFVWLRTPRVVVSILFLAFCAAITFWLVGTFGMFLNRDNPELAVFWDRFVYIGVVFVPSLMHHFSLEITGNKGQRKLLLLSYTYSFVFLIISRTRYFVDGLNVFPNVVHSRAMIGHHVFLALFFPIASLMFVNLFKAYRATADKHLRRTYCLVAAAFLNILIIGGTAYLPAYGIDIGYPFSYFSGVFFPVILGFAVTHYQFLSSRVLMAEMGSFFIGLILLVHVVLSKGIGEAIFNSTFLAIFLFYGVEMVRAMRAEVRSREDNQALAAKLADANAKLQDAVEHLHELDKAKSEFISIASHQLRTPVTVVKGYLSLAMSGAYGPVNGQLNEKMAQMFEMNERLVRLINDLLNLAHIERGKTDFSPQAIDARKFIAHVIAELSGKAKEKGIALAFDPPKNGPPKAYVDSAKFTEVMSNLIDNAIKYSEKGTVRVALRQERKAKRLVVTVEDQGFGMTEEEAGHMFEKFYRSKSTHVLRETGTGLGLYVCMKFIRGMGGDIWLERTAPGKGTTFAISLPLASKGA